MSPSVWIAVVLIFIVAIALFAIPLVRRRGRKPAAPAASEAELDALAAALLQAVGGKENIADVEYCSTRLRFEVKKYAAVDEAAAKAAGAAGVVRPGKNTCQIAVGTQAPQVYAALKKLM